MMILFIMASCATTKNSLNLRDRPKYILDPNTKKIASGGSNIELFEHQLRPIDYLLKNPELKGLLINHHMGTGKTILGLGFSESFADHPVIILAPRFLESQWRRQIAQYAPKNPARFKFISYHDAPKALANMDISNHLIVADEVHNLIKLMRSLDHDQNEKYSEVYTKLRSAYKILGLSGTPIYDDESDLAFIINLVSGQDLMPYNRESFRLEYTKLNPAPQFFRGYFIESNLVVTLAPTVLGSFLGAMVGLPGFYAGIAIGALTPIAASILLPLNRFKIREIDVEPLAPIANRYVSYFKFPDTSFVDFPEQKTILKEIPYHSKAYSFFMHFVEGDLPVDQLQRLLKSNGVHKSDEYVKVNSSAIHDQLYAQIGAGRDIGNFDFLQSDGQRIEAPKFEELYTYLIEHPEPSVLYSNYYETGILAFYNFLKRKGYAEQVEIISPSLPGAEVSAIVDRYHQGKTRLLLLHPEITEGLSLNGTRHLHILEPILNNTILEQVIGRTRRFGSHSQLPMNERFVNVVMWQSSSKGRYSNASEIERSNWYKRYRELSFMSKWGMGMWQIDKKYEAKEFNPEELAVFKLETLKKNLSAMQTFLETESIENLY